jgi:general stress protein YciG
MPKKTPIVKDKAFYQRVGRLGGLKTKERMLAKDPNYYATIGFRGGETIKLRGKEYYTMISKMRSNKEAAV